MLNKNTCIDLGVIFPVNHIISFILRHFGMKQYCPVIEFRHFGFFSMTVNLDLLGIDFRGTSEPRLCYP
ncbi:hypothetical protein DW683_00695 [Bacteroides sp. AM25-34]|jgi:hypothetical protein|nr:hypothetical protein DW683_00695 [Bacteroides sp. AM25-34]